MFKVPFSQARFILSAPNRLSWPVAKVDEIIVLGRSNVGKSTFVNALTGTRQLAKVSSAPGLTKLLNFFYLQDDLVLVDAPGYGFARGAKEQIDPWNQMIKDYLIHRAQLKAVIVLLDGRRTPSDEDGTLLNFLHDHRLRVGFVVTKMDTLNQSERATLVARMKVMIPYFDERPILFSEKNPANWIPLVDRFLSTLLHR